MVFLRQLIVLVSELAYVTTHFDLPSSPHFVADFLQAKCCFTRKTAFLRFEPLFVELRSNVRCSCLVRWKARSGLPITVN